MRIHTFSLVFVLLLLPCSAATACAPDSLFPQIAAWKFTQDETVYKPNNLWDVIDGAADLFLEYNFVDLHIGRYQQAGDVEIKVELYRHNSAADAFGIYAQERYPDYHFIDLGVQGYIEKGSLNFFGGVYYVKISTIQEGKEVQDAMLIVGKKVEEHLRQARSWPVMLRAFPPKGKQLNSEQYFAKNFLGYSVLNTAYTASYEDGGSFKAFIIQQETSELARKMLEDYLKAAPKDAATIRDGGRFEVKDPHNGHVDLLLTNNYVVGLLGSGIEKIKENFLAEVASNLSTLK